MPYISIIIPVYNAQKYLRRCVNSILAQSYCDYELILVNDSSTDSSPAICDALVHSDTRVKVIHCEENGGAGQARNLGLAAAAGK